jgi:hypothetical protein
MSAAPANALAAKKCLPALRRVQGSPPRFFCLNGSSALFCQRSQSVKSVKSVVKEIPQKANEFAKIQANPA